MRVVKTVGAQVLNATTEQELSETNGTQANYRLPAKAQFLHAIRPIVDAPAGKTATEAVMTYFKLKSDSNHFGSYTVLAAPIGSYLGVDGLSARDLAPWYPVNAPLVGGSEIEIWAAGLIDHTIEPYAQCDLLLSDYVPPNAPQVHAKIGTLTTMGAATAGETKGSGIHLDSGHSIIEVNGYAVGTTVAAAKGITGKFRLSSAGFNAMGDTTFAVEPIGGAKTALDAAGTATVIEIAHLTRVRDLDIPITNPIDIDDYFNLLVALTTAGKFIAGVLYI